MPWSRGGRSLGLDDELADFAAVVDGAEHDHAVAEGELGVHDGGVVGAEVDGLLFEAEGADEPVDGGEGVAVTEAGDDGGAAGFGLAGHGSKSVTLVGWCLGRIGPAGTPSSLFSEFFCFHLFTGCVGLQNRHDKGVMAKIVFLNELAQALGRGCLSF